jgi:hypothetical protein
VQVRQLFAHCTQDWAFAATAYAGSQTAQVPLRVQATQFVGQLMQVNPSSETVLAAQGVHTPLLTNWKGGWHSLQALAAVQTRQLSGQRVQVVPDRKYPAMQPEQEAGPGAVQARHQPWQATQPLPSGYIPVLQALHMPVTESQALQLVLQGAQVVPLIR